MRNTLRWAVGFGLAGLIAAVGWWMSGEPAASATANASDPPPVTLPDSYPLPTPASGPKPADLGKAVFPEGALPASPPSSPPAPLPAIPASPGGLPPLPDPVVPLPKPPEPVTPV